jgi:hypothetical protein
MGAILLLVGEQRDVAFIVRSSRFRLSNFVGHARRVSPGLFSVAGAVAGGVKSVSALISAPASTMMVDNDGNDRAVGGVMVSEV